MAGRGVVVREAGQVFFDAGGNEFYFVECKVFENSDKVNFSRFPIKCINEKLPSAILVVVTDQAGQKQGYLRYFKSISSNGFYMWRNWDFYQDTGLQLRKGRTALETIPLRPLDLVGTNEPHSPGDLIKKITKSSSKLNELHQEHLLQMLKAIKNQKPFPLLKNARKFIAPYSKYLGELLAPLALSYDASIKNRSGKSLKCASYITYPGAANTQLVDSELMFPDGKISISSKSRKKGGASVSLSSLCQVLDSEPFDSVFLKRYAKPISIMRTINNNSQKEGPLELAEELNLITSNERKYVENLLEEPVDLNVYRSEYEPPSQNLLDLAYFYGKKTPYSVDESVENYSPAFHYVAGIAKKTAEVVSEKYDIDGACREILDKTNMVQVYCGLTCSGEDARFKPFEVISPKEYEGNIFLDASKNYYATNINGKISFKIERPRNDL